MRDGADSTRAVAHGPRATSDERRATSPFLTPRWVLCATWPDYLKASRALLPSTVHKRVHTVLLLRRCTIFYRWKSISVICAVDFVRFAAGTPTNLLQCAFRFTSKSSALVLFDLSQQCYESAAF